jgi:hypothetical protein
VQRQARLSFSTAIAFAFAFAFCALASPSTALAAEQQDEPPITSPVAPVRLESETTFGGYVRASSTWSSLAARRTQGSNIGGGVLFSGALSPPRSWLTLAYDTELAAGSGDSDLDGVARAYVLAGIEPRMFGRITPFLRAGAGFDYRGNDQYLASVLDLPVAQAGMVLREVDTSLRIGAFGGYAATGRFDAGPGTERVLDGATTWGGFADVRGIAGGGAYVLPMFLRTEVRTFGRPGANAGAPIEWTGRLCVRADALQGCVDGAYMLGRVNVQGEKTPLDATIGYAGISLGYSDSIAHR